ncbi:hypothetical protein PHISCL_08468 [Aspergillus sclerotialis]|uniref:Uncharacterized protein n=1 Tax=Aspergillus sclerotialis TaxID=2070753 RepID=A0A3A2ZQ26_9EURO|nr:hypothetical protein PHISCL_08468 [Aspergillus sclerotialis]
MNVAKASSANFAFRYEPTFVVPFIAGRYLMSQLHCLRPKLDHFYRNCDRQVLSWMVRSSIKRTEYKQAPRVWAHRRTRVAFRNALKERGFDPQGKRIGNTPGAVLEGDFTGSLTILIRKECVTQDFPTIQKDLSQLLDRVLLQARNFSDAQGQVKPKKRSKRKIGKEVKREQKAEDGSILTPA